MLFKAIPKKFYHAPAVWGKAAGIVATTFDPSNKSSTVTLSGGNLIATGTVSTGSPDATQGARGTVGHSTGKYYAEFTITTLDTSNGSIGIINSSYIIGTTSPASAGSACWFNNGFVLVNGSSPDSFLGPSGGDVVSVAVDLVNSRIWFRKNANNWNANGTGGSNNPATNVGGYDISSITGGIVYPFAGMQSNGVWTANFGGSAYAQSVPSGFGNW